MHKEISHYCCFYFDGDLYVLDLEQDELSNLIGEPVEFLFSEREHWQRNDDANRADEHPFGFYDLTLMTVVNGELSYVNDLCLESEQEQYASSNK